MALTTNLLHTVPQVTSYMQNGMSTDVGDGVKFPLQTGVPIQSNYMFKVIPASFSTTCISSANDYQSGGQPLNLSNTGSGANTISIALNDRNLLNYDIPNFNRRGILLDCERCISLTVYNGSSIRSFTAYIEGFDYRGKAISFSANFSGSMTTAVILQPISIVTSVRFSNDFDANGSGTAQQISIGNSNIIALPYYLSGNNYVINATWAGNTLAQSAVTPGYNWRANGAAGYPARGYVTLPSNADGNSLLTCCYYVPGSDSELNAELNNENFSSLKIAQVQRSTPALAGVPVTNVLPLLTEYDLTGVVYPADNDFLYTYNLAKTS